MIALIETLGIGQNQETKDSPAKLPDAGPDPCHLFGSIHNIIENQSRKPTPLAVGGIAVFAIA